MANGFIEVDKENSFSIRWSGFDEIINIIVHELSDLNSLVKTTELITNLESYIPPKDLDQELDMGWGFIQGENGITSRTIELYKFDDESIKLFWIAAEKAYKNLMEFGTEYSGLHPNYLKELIDYKSS